MSTQFQVIFATVILVLATGVDSIALPDNGLVGHRHLNARAAATASISSISSASSAPASSSSATTQVGGDAKAVVNGAATATASASSDQATAICDAPGYVNFS